jgi:hypothetical protein
MCHVTSLPSIHLVNQRVERYPDPVMGLGSSPAEQPSGETIYSTPHACPNPSERIPCRHPSLATFLNPDHPSRPHCPPQATLPPASVPAGKSISLSPHRYRHPPAPSPSHTLSSPSHRSLSLSLSLALSLALSPASLPCPHSCPKSKAFLSLSLPPAPRATLPPSLSCHRYPSLTPSPLIVSPSPLFPSPSLVSCLPISLGLPRSASPRILSYPHPRSLSLSRCQPPRLNREGFSFSFSRPLPPSLCTTLTSSFRPCPRLRSCADTLGMYCNASRFRWLLTLTPLSGPHTCPLRPCPRHSCPPTLTPTTRTFTQ